MQPRLLLIANRFELDRLAGSGGMGEVYRAHDRHTGGWVALKLLRAEGSSGQESQRFLREAQLLAELQHPGIVRYVAHGQAYDGQPFLAMEWLEGEDLGQRLRRGPLGLSDCYRLVDRVVAALGAMHECGVVHRDLKPTTVPIVEKLAFAFPAASRSGGERQADLENPCCISPAQ